MSISSENAGGEIPRVPPGFRFHPTEEELLNYYLAKKVSSGAIDDLGVIRDVDLNKLEPWDIQEKCGIGSAAQGDWYFFSHKDRKYPTGTRTNRATAAGFWKATGRDKAVYSPADCRRIGMRKTLVFHIGRAPHGRKSNWIMHEYRLDDRHSDDRRNTTISRSAGQLVSSPSSMRKQEDGWVVCRVFKKTSSCRASSTAVVGSAGEDVTSTACNRDSTCLFAADDDCGSLQEMFEKLPGLQSPCDDASSQAAAADAEPVGDWTAFDRLLAWQFEGPSSKSLHRGNDDDGRGDEKFFSYPRGGGGSDLRSLTRTTPAMSDRNSNV